MRNGEAQHRLTKRGTWPKRVIKWSIMVVENYEIDEMRMRVDTELRREREGPAKRRPHAV
jgi:hypothetical protein